MARKYSDKEVAEVLLQILDTRPGITYSYSGIDDVQYMGQGMYVIDVYWDDLRKAAEQTD